MKVRPGQQMTGMRAPADGFEVEVTAREMLSEAFSQHLVEWIQTVLLVKFDVDQPIAVDIKIRGMFKRDRS